MHINNKKSTAKFESSFRKRNRSSFKIIGLSLDLLKSRCLWFVIQIQAISSIVACSINCLLRVIFVVTLYAVLPPALSVCRSGRLLVRTL